MRWQICRLSGSGGGGFLTTVVSTIFVSHPFTVGSETAKPSPLTEFLGIDYLVIAGQMLEDPDEHGALDPRPVLSVAGSSMI